LKALWLVLLAACIDPVDPQWSLNHDHVVVARATPPRIHAGDTTNLDALVAHAGGPTTIESPLTAAAGRNQVVASGDRWTINAPATAPYAGDTMAVEVTMTFARGTDRALDPVRVRKTVWLGEPSQNPAMPPITVGGAPAGDSLVVPRDQDVYLSTTVPAGWRVNWLTSAGQLYQDDEPTSFLHVLPTDAQSGELACVIRDDQGGVAWQVWPIAAQ
jgi:hypothetical protein